MKKSLWVFVAAIAGGLLGVWIGFQWSGGEKPLPPIALETPAPETTRVDPEPPTMRPQAQPWAEPARRSGPGPWQRPNPTRAPGAAPGAVEPPKAPAAVARRAPEADDTARASDPAPAPVAAVETALAVDEPIPLQLPTGTIRGRVIWKGPYPSLAPFTITKDNATCGTEKPSNRLIIGTNGGVRYALITVVGMRNKGKRLTLFPDNPMVDQVGCEYIPHLQVVPRGSTLLIANSDPILHNIHAYLGKLLLGRPSSAQATVFNVGMPIKGQRVPKVLNRAGLLELQCDAGHTWMNAFVVIVDHPYYAVTDANGYFTIPDVPIGTRRVGMWHEGWEVRSTTPEGRAVFSESVGTIERVRVRAGQTTTVNFDLSAIARGP
jgi:hypothetical protein